jgi:hypothetical protein
MRTRGTFERKPLTFSSQPVIFSQKTAGVIWWVVVTMLLAAVVAFSAAWLTQNRSTDVRVGCSTEGGIPCKP